MRWNRSFEWKISHNGTKNGKMPICVSKTEYNIVALLENGAKLVSEVGVGAQIIAADDSDWRKVEDKTIKLMVNHGLIHQTGEYPRYRYRLCTGVSLSNLKKENR